MARNLVRQASRLRLHNQQDRRQRSDERYDSRDAEASKTQHEGGSVAQRATHRMFDDPTRRLAQQAPLVSDMRLDFRTSYETLFLLVELSDAMRRGVRHYKLDGTPLDCLNNVVEALIFDGEVFFDDACSAAPAGH